MRPSILGPQSLMGIVFVRTTIFLRFDAGPSEPCDGANGMADFRLKPARSPLRSDVEVMTMSSSHEDRIKSVYLGRLWSGRQRIHPLEFAVHQKGSCARREL